MAVNFVEKIDGKVKINYVLVSVSDKFGLDSFIPRLITINPEIQFISTGGTFETIKGILKNDASKYLKQVSEYTGQPEMQGGLVKTLDFKIYLGLLSETYNDAHKKDLARTNAIAIDMVVVNLYPFEITAGRPGSTPEMARANIDIGGPCMIRAAAKNFLRVASITDSADYGMIAAELEAEHGYISLKTRYMLAGKAFTHTAQYDKAISEYYQKITFEKASECYSINK
jgi:phosphoribosylaminoimidazolecarboxamide formyltransferase/IMP cyclohydrolase